MSLKHAGHPPELVAAFLIRCLFTLFAEDVGLLKRAGFTELLASVRDNPAQLVPLVEHLWRDMNAGTDFSVILREEWTAVHSAAFTLHEQGKDAEAVKLVSAFQVRLANVRVLHPAYGWHDLAPRLVGRPGGTTPLPDKPADQAEAEEELLTRLVALNRERAAEEARGQVRWLRPDFQAPGVAPPRGGERGASPAPETAGILPARGTQAHVPWPKTLPEQFQALRTALAEHTARGGPTTPEQLAQVFTRAPRAKVAELLATLATLGHARHLPDGRFAPG